MTLRLIFIQFQYSGSAILSFWKQNMQYVKHFWFSSIIFPLHHGLLSRHGEVMGGNRDFQGNRPFPSSKKSNFQSEAKCKPTDMKMIFNCDVNKTHFHNKGFALNLVLKVRFGTRKWPIGMPNNEGMRRQPPPGGWEGKNFEVTCSELRWRSGQEAGKNRGLQCIIPPARRPNTTEFIGVTYFPRHHSSSQSFDPFGQRRRSKLWERECCVHGPIMYAVRIVNVCFLWSFQRLKTPKGRISHSLLQYKRNNRDHWHMVLLLLKTQIQSLTYVTQTKLKIAHVNFKLFKIVL